jgi:hypothetical protein
MQTRTMQQAMQENDLPVGIRKHQNPFYWREDLVAFRRARLQRRQLEKNLKRTLHETNCKK